MAEPADTLARYGIQRASEVVEIAANTGLALPIAASVLEQETGGGYNVWGSDGVSTGGIYVKGAPVTREAYLAYKARRAQLGNQGVGPVQLTATVYQNQADALGGCWDWRNNCTVGFKAMSDLVRQFGTSDGMRRYNGSGPMAETYRQQMLTRVSKWSGRLAGLPLSTPASTPRKANDMSFIPLPLAPDGSFKVAVSVEAGNSSLAFSRAFVTFGSCWGATDFRVAALGQDGLVMGPAAEKKKTVANNMRDFLEVPSGAVLVTIEGKAGSGAIPAASLVGLSR